MEQTIIPGRNGGYPCIEQLPELSGVPVSSAPYPEYVLRAYSGRNSGYPCLLKLPELGELSASSPPYPDYILRCLGSAVNEGYPCITSLAGAMTHRISELYFADKAAAAMYYNGERILTAFCGEKKVFGVYYTLTDGRTQ